MTLSEDPNQVEAPDTTTTVPQITDMIEPALLQEFQDTFADSVGVSVLIRDAVKRERHKDAPFPAGLKAKAEAASATA